MIISTAYKKQRETAGPMKLILMMGQITDGHQPQPTAGLITGTTNCNPITAQIINTMPTAIVYKKMSMDKFRITFIMRITAYSRERIHSCEKG
jgi:hypothetical protein